VEPAEGAAQVERAGPQVEAEREVPAERRREARPAPVKPEQGRPDRAKLAAAKQVAAKRAADKLAADKRAVPPEDLPARVARPVAGAAAISTADALAASRRQRAIARPAHFSRLRSEGSSYRAGAGGRSTELTGNLAE
jgi:hypothetical protein